jgi:hypothetical protein
MGQVGTWDRETTNVVLGRLQDRPLRFFTPAEAPTVRALVDRLLAQDDEPRIPVVEMIDTRLAERSGDGYRYHDMPEDPEAWRASISFLDDDARVNHERAFPDLERRQQLRLIETIRSAKGQWHGLPAARVFSLWIRYACTAFYSHPWAWNEIGFGGPAYPRGYKNLGFERREPWEVADVDGADPVPWTQRAEAVRRRHADALAERESP